MSSSHNSLWERSIFWWKYFALIMISWLAFKQLFHVNYCQKPKMWVQSPHSGDSSSHLFIKRIIIIQILSISVRDTTHETNTSALPTLPVPTQSLCITFSTAEQITEQEHISTSLLFSALLALLCSALHSYTQLHSYTATQLHSYTATYSYTAIQLHSYTAIQPHSYTDRQTDRQTDRDR